MILCDARYRIAIAKMENTKTLLKNSFRFCETSLSCVFLNHHFCKNFLNSSFQNYWTS